MKKTKLVLKRQTIAKLTRDQLSEAQGGGPGSINANCSGSCHTCPNRCNTATVEQFGCGCEGE